MRSNNPLCVVQQSSPFRRVLADHPFATILFRSRLDGARPGLRELTSVDVYVFQESFHHNK
jgi:hypothetical protein